MRLWVSLCCALLMVGGGCAGPHSTGGLWAQQNLEQEAALFRLTDAQRAEQAHAVDLSLADQALASERARLAAELVNCPGPRQALSVSTGDRTRDGIRIRVEGDSQRSANL